MKILFNNKIHNSWNKFLTPQIIEEIKTIQNKIDGNINPEPENVLRFLYTDFDNIKCIVIGQDPYPAFPKIIDNKETYIATGRSFEIGTLNSWTDKFAQHSLKNMIRLIYQAYFNELISYEECKKRILSKQFPISSPQQWHQEMESQGVLFLNKTLTCIQGKPLSHEDLWNDFSINLIKFISQSKPDTIWFLWGGEARKLKKYIQQGKIYETEHPRLYNIDKETSFLNSTCFMDTKNIINWMHA